MTPLGRVRRRVVRYAQDSWATRRGASSAVRRRLLLRTAATGPAVLVAPPGDGNIGDQAMVESFFENVAGPIVVVQRANGDIVVPAQFADRVEVVSLPDLIYGKAAARDTSLARYQEIVAAAGSVSIVGADMLDGVYSRVGSVNRLLLAELAALAGTPTRILGFSWSDRARRSALAALRHAAAAGVVPIVRDPDSAGRVRAAAVAGVVDGSDIVFAANSVEPFVIDGLAAGRRYAIVNASALVRRVAGAAAYGPIVQRILADDIDVVLLPHVLRGSSNDLGSCREVAQLQTDPRVHLVERALAPAQVRGLAAAAEFVVTGRMHLAIMAAHGGVPAITFSTQGKVSGLFALLGVDRLCVEPGPQMAANVLPLIDELVTTSTARDMIRSRLDGVRELAMRNVRDLTIPVPTSAA